MNALHNDRLWPSLDLYLLVLVCSVSIFHSSFQSCCPFFFYDRVAGVFARASCKIDFMMTAHFVVFILNGCS